MQAAHRVIGRTGLGAHRVGAAAAILQECAGEVGAAMLVNGQGIGPARILEYPLLYRGRFRWRLVRVQVPVEGGSFVREYADTLVTAERAASGAGDRSAGRARGSGPGIYCLEQVAGQRIAACWRAIRSQLLEHLPIYRHEFMVSGADPARPGHPGQ